MKYLSNAVELVSQAIVKKEHLTIYGDYDLDGVMCLLEWKTFLDTIGHTNYTLVEYTKRSHAIDKNVSSIAVENNSDLIIICDTGCSELNHLRFLSGISRVLVLDHHLGNIREEDLNDRITIVNPAMWKDNKKMSAACVVYEVIMEYINTYDYPSVEYYRRLLSFYPFLSIFADGAYGLNDYCYSIYQQAQTAIFPPEFGYIKNEYRSTKRFLLFSAAPPINAAFRNGRLDLINKLFLRRVPLLTYERADLFDELQILRDKMRTHIERLSNLVDVQEIGKFVLVDLSGYLNQSIPNEVIWANKGLVANKIAERYKAVCITIVNEGSYYSLSVRDYLGRDVLSIMQLFYEVGGHPSAFGGKLTSLQVLNLKNDLKLISEHLSPPVERTVLPFRSLTVEQIDTIVNNNEFAHPNELTLVSIPKVNLKLEKTPAEWGEQYYQYHVKYAGDRKLYIKQEDFDSSMKSHILVHLYKGKNISGQMVERA